MFARAATRTASLFGLHLAALARLTPFAWWRGVYRKPPRGRSPVGRAIIADRSSSVRKPPRGRSPVGRAIIADRSSSVRKLQRLARRGDVILRET